jgi:hypothetical protein
MDIKQQIQAFINDILEPKKSELALLHSAILAISPKAQLWFLDGKNEQQKVVANPTIGYGMQNMQYAGGKTKPFYQIGISPNTTGISVYVLGLTDKTYLSNTYGKKIGKASVTGYCIKFKSIKDIDMPTLKAAIKFGFEHSS